MNLTRSQQRILQAIKELQSEQGHSPTLQELASHLGIKAPTVHQHLKKMQETGAIHRESKKARSIEILLPSRSMIDEVVLVPVIGLIAAGKPNWSSEDFLGEVAVAREWVKGRCYALRVDGLSMLGANISDGDYVLVRQQSIAQHGEIVVARVNDKATLKRLYAQGDKVELRAENPDYQPIEVSLEDDFRILGKVLRILKRAM